MVGLRGRKDRTKAVGKGGRPFSFSFNFFPKFALLGHVLKGGSIENEGS